MGDWQPIETAPRDGGYVIVARFRNGDELCWVKHSRWIKAEELASENYGDPEEWDDGWTDGNDEDELCFPTHWMPLPAPPVLP